MSRSGHGWDDTAMESFLSPLKTGQTRKAARTEESSLTGFDE
jgi:hypothetical protein